MKTLLKKMLMSLVVFSVLFVVVDTVIRIYARSKHQANPERILFQTDQALGAWVHVPNSSASVSWRGTPPHQVSFNAFGFRGPFPKKKEKKQGEIRILTLGGSSTEAGFVADGKTWPEILQRELDRVVGTGRVEVINLGTSGYTTAISVKNFRIRGLPLKPDVVVVYQANNDFLHFLQKRFNKDLVVEESHIDYEGRAASWLERLLCKSIIVDRLNRKHYSQRGALNRAYLNAYWADRQKTALDLGGAEKATLEALSELKELARKNEFKIVIGRQATLIKPEMSQAEIHAMWEILRYRYKGKHLDWSVFVDGLDQIKKAQAQFASEHCLAWVDIEAAVPKDLDHFIDHVHYFEKGEEAVGMAFSRGILSHPELAAILSGETPICVHRPDQQDK